MSTYSCTIYHVVFSTKDRNAVLVGDRIRLYCYMGGILSNNGCHPELINGTADHVHALFHIPPAKSPSEIVRILKVESSKFISRHQLYPEFCGWQKGYGIFTVSCSHVERVRNYLANQEHHHRRKTYIEEYQALLHAHNIDYDERYFP